MGLFNVPFARILDPIANSQISIDPLLAAQNRKLFLVEHLSYHTLLSSPLISDQAICVW